MKQFLLVLFLFVLEISTAQTICNATYPIDYIYYPNSTSTQTNTGTAYCSYLCGPNTVLVDTNSFGCREYYVNSFCTLTFKTPFCGVNSEIFVKNNGVLNLVGGGTNNLAISFEPLAVINNTAGVSYFPSSCASVSFPSGNCSTGIREEKNHENIVLLYPNPASSRFFISIENNDFKTSEIEIINTLGQTVFKSKFKPELDVSELSNGLYMLQITNSQNQIAQKRLIITK